jgi:hypothetical protein
VADQPKKKTTRGLRNDARKNGKASKSTPDMFKGVRGAYRGSHTRGVTLSEAQKVAMGGGALVRIRKPLPRDDQ